MIAIHPEAGLTTGDFEGAGIKRVLSIAAAETYVLASSEKLNAASPYSVELTQIAGITTEKTASYDPVETQTAVAINVVRA